MSWRQWNELAVEENRDEEHREGSHYYFAAWLDKQVLSLMDCYWIYLAVNSYKIRGLNFDGRRSTWNFEYRMRNFFDGAKVKVK